MILRENNVEIDEKENRILVEDSDKGQTLVAISKNGNIKNYQERQEVVVWLDGGIVTSAPTSPKALNIEITTSDQ